MSRKSFSQVLRRAVLSLGLPSIGTIAAAPVFIWLGQYAVFRFLCILLIFNSILYCVLIARRPVLRDGNASPAEQISFLNAMQHHRQDRRLRRNDEIAKRMFDVTVASVMLLALLPLLAIISCILLYEGRPLIIRHRRVGRGGKNFPCYKFRTLVVDADAVLLRHLKENPAAQKEWEANKKLKDDPRITRVGRVLRKTSMDEFPQLLNVLIGQMSIVGPTPIVPAERVFYGPYIRFYESVKPGLVSTWELEEHRHSNRKADYAVRVACDVDYVRNQSYMNDLLILLKTIPAVLRTRVDHPGKVNLESAATYRMRLRRSR